MKRPEIIISGCFAACEKNNKLTAGGMLAMSISLAIVFKTLWTGIAGAIGAGTRHAIATRARQRYGDDFPWGTLGINLTGAGVIGLVTGLLAHHHALTEWRAPIVLGFLGGYTTFSTFMLELARLRARATHHPSLPFFVYLCASLILGPLLAYLGLVVGRML